MVKQDVKVAKKEPTTTFRIRKIAKSGGSRYLSVGSILPEDWLAVKVIVVGMKESSCVLELVKIA